MKTTSFQRWVVLCFAGFITLSFLGISNSSISKLSYSESKSNAGLLIGSANNIRSDEYLRWTPQFIGEHRFDNSVSESDFSRSQLGEKEKSSNLSKITSFLAFDTFIKEKIESILPLEIAFAFHWWYYILLASIFIPGLLRELTIPLTFGIPTFFIIYFSPGNQWWSNGQIQIFAIASAGFYFLLRSLKANSDSKVIKSLFAILAIQFLSQLPFQYQPWSIPISIFFLLISFTFLLVQSKEKGKVAKKLIYLLFTTLLVSLITIISKASSLGVLAKTSYPGQRRIQIATSNYQILQTPITLRMKEFGKNLLFGNPSEAAIAFNEVGLLIVLLIPLFLIFWKRDKLAQILLITSLTLFTFYLWVFGIWSENFLFGNPLIFVSQDRLAQILGNMSIFVLPILISFFSTQKSIQDSKKIKLLILFIMIAIGIGAAFNLNNSNEFNGFNKTELISLYASIFFMILCTSIIFFRKNYSQYAFAVLALVISLLGLIINPIQRGLGEILSSEIAVQIKQLAGHDSAFWVTDDLTLDPLLIANAGKLISGQQVIGPNIEFWTKLDREKTYFQVWNRGSSFVTFNWNNEESVLIDNPVNDVIRINIDPCNEILNELDISYILSSHEVEQNCLRLTFTSTTETSNYYIYKRVQ